MVKVEEDVVPGIPNHISKCKYFNTSTRQAFRRSGFPESFENKIAPWKIIFFTKKFYIPSSWGFIFTFWIVNI